MKKEVTILKSGNTIAIPISEAPVDLLTKELSYLHSWMEHGVRGKKAQFHQEVRQACAVVEDSSGVFEPSWQARRGFLTRVANCLNTHGYKVSVADVTPPEHRKRFVPDWSLLDPPINWRYRQKEVAMLPSKFYNGRINCPTGYGKSLIIAAMCQIYPKARIVVSTYSQDVLKSIYRRIKPRVASCGIYCSSQKTSENYRVMCYSGKSLRRCIKPPDILLVDEWHEWGTEDYLNTLTQFPYTRMFGFSANTERPDGMEFELEGYMGPILVNIPYALAVEKGLVSPIEVEWVSTVHIRHPAPKARGVYKEKQCIWKNYSRNQLIADQARRFGENDQVLITVKTVEHAAHLKSLLPEFTLVYSDGVSTQAKVKSLRNSGLLPPDEPRMTSKRREYLRHMFEKDKLKKVIATSVWNRGVDFATLSVLIRGDASDTVIADTQIPGRVARINDCKEAGLIIDFDDVFDDGLKRKAANRRRRYKKHGWEQRKARR